MQGEKQDVFFRGVKNPSVLKHNLLRLRLCNLWAVAFGFYFHTQKLSAQDVFLGVKTQNINLLQSRK